MKHFLQICCIALCSPAIAEVHVIGAADFAFIPDELHALVGDTIRWEYLSGTPHTVTSGVDCSWDGYFHASLSSFDPVVEWVVPVDAPSEFAYFCAPHCIHGMTGMIYISPLCAADVNGDNIVNVSDLLAVIDQWGQVKSPADVTNDGLVNVSDLLLIIGNWGPCQ